MKGLVEEVPRHERLITIEDTAELTLPNHPNAVHLYYSKDAQGMAKVTAKSLLEACLRMKPDRIFLAEVRGDECFYFVRLAASGHPGSITSVHAGSCALAFEQMALMIRESGAGGGLRMNEIKWLLGVVVDVVVQFDRDERGRFISEILYEPRRQRLGALGRASGAGGGMSSLAALPMSSWPPARKALRRCLALTCLVGLGVRSALPLRGALPAAQQGGSAARHGSPASSTTGRWYADDPRHAQAARRLDRGVRPGAARRATRRTRRRSTQAPAAAR